MLRSALPHVLKARGSVVASKSTAVGGAPVTACGRGYGMRWKRPSGSLRSQPRPDSLVSFPRSGSSRPLTSTSRPSAVPTS